MSASNTTNPYNDSFDSNDWIKLLFSLGITMGAGFAYLAMQDPRVRRVALDNLSLLLPVFERRRNPFQSTQKQALLLNAPLVEPLRVLSLSESACILERNVAANGDCFFLCFAVSLLEYVCEKEYALEEIIEVVESDSRLRPDQKEIFIRYLEEAACYGRIEDLEHAFFQKNERMQNLVCYLRTILVSEIYKEPEFEDDAIPELEISATKANVATRRDFYADLLGSLDRDPKERSRYGFSLEDDCYSPDRFNKLMNLMENEKFYPSDTCIRILSKKFQIGFGIYQKDRGQKRIEMRSCVEDLPLAGLLLLQNEHYSKIYHISDFFDVKDHLFMDQNETLRTKISIQSSKENFPYVLLTSGLAYVLSKADQEYEAFLNLLDPDKKETLESLFTECGWIEDVRDRQILKNSDKMRTMILRLKEISPPDLVNIKDSNLFSLLGVSFETQNEEIPGENTNCCSLGRFSQKEENSTQGMLYPRDSFLTL